MEISLVVKIGSMALIQKQDTAIDYNIFQRLASDLQPGMILITSGAAEIGRLDYIRRTGKELNGFPEADKVDYAAQGQAILMSVYRQFINPEYGVRQILLEHNHFNDEKRREHIHALFKRAVEQNTIPIVNYNDTVSDEEVRKMELASCREKSEDVVECIDNDETAEVVAKLMGAKTLLLLTNTQGIYLDKNNPDTLVTNISGKNIKEVEEKVNNLMQHCQGASRKGAAGAGAKLAYALRAVQAGANVVIGNAKYHIQDLVEGNVPCTRISVEK